jgi:hypothetical protein
LCGVGRHQERAVLLDGRFQFEKPLAMVLFALLHHRAEASFSSTTEAKRNRFRKSTTGITLPRTLMPPRMEPGAPGTSESSGIFNISRMSSLAIPLRSPVL